MMSWHRKRSPTAQPADPPSTKYNRTEGFTNPKNVFTYAESDEDNPVIAIILVRFVKIGDREIEYNKKFKLILHTKLGNPHYQPEIQAQTTLINFMVTRDGLEEQLLAEVVKAERPDLETAKVEYNILITYII